MNILEELGKKYGTDKIGKHNYLPVYYEMFKDRRETVKNVLEIGVGEGKGLRMWKDFFTNARIYGADNEVERLFNEERIQVYLIDQSLAKDVMEMSYWSYKMDLVIDDGSHDPMDQMFTCFGLMPFLKKDVVYVIEDVADPEIAKYLSKKYDLRVIECGERYDDRLIIVRHK